MEEGAGAAPISPPHAALSEAAEVYFSAIQKIGEQALQSPTSQILGKPLPLPLPPPPSWALRGTPPSLASTPGCLLRPRTRPLCLSPWCLSSCPGPVLPTILGAQRGLLLGSYLSRKCAPLSPHPGHPPKTQAFSPRPRAQTLVLEPKPLPTTPHTAVPGLGQALPESRSPVGNPWTLVPRSRFEQPLWQLLWGKKAGGAGTPTAATALCASR